MSAFTAPAVALRNGVDYLPAATLQSAVDALAWRDGTDSVRWVSAACSSTTAITTTPTDVAGCSVTFTLYGTSSVVVVNGAFSVSIAAGGATVAVGELLVDGVVQTGQAIKDGSVADAQAAQQVWLPTLANGSHTLKLRVSKTANLGTLSVEITQSVISVLIFDHR